MKRNLRNLYSTALVQTAEGALTEVHSMLNRMVELSTQSANGTYSTTNRQEMQKEIMRLKIVTAFAPFALSAYLKSPVPNVLTKVDEFVV